MPNLDGTGPQGQGPMTGGRRGRCRNLQTQNTQTAKQTDETKEVLGVGRGGRPRGCGMGNCYGGNQRKGQGNCRNKNDILNHNYYSPLYR